MAEVEEEVVEALAYPDLDGVSLEERRRIWVLTFMLEAGKAAATPKTLIADAKAIEGYLTGETPNIKAVT
jgi:hypothetical protein